MSGGWPDDFDPATVGIAETPWTHLSRLQAWEYADPGRQHPECHEAAWMLTGGYLDSERPFGHMARHRGPLGFFGKPPGRGAP